MILVGRTVKKTTTKKKTLSPTWNEPFDFKVDSARERNIFKPRLSGQSDTSTAAKLTNRGRLWFTVMNQFGQTANLISGLNCLLYDLQSVHIGTYSTCLGINSRWHDLYR